MSQPTPTGAAGDEGITDAVVPDPSATGSQDDVVAITSARDEAVTRARQEQARADRAEAALRAAQASQPKPTTEPASAAPGLTAEGVLELMQKRDTLNAASVALREQFPNADPSIFTNPLSYGSAEEMRAKAEDSHSAFQARLDALGVVPKSEVDALKTRFTEKYGAIEEPPATTEAGSATGDPTVEEVRKWSMADMDAFAAKHGEAKLDQVLRSAS